MNLDERLRAAWPAWRLLVVERQVTMSELENYSMDDVEDHLEVIDAVQEFMSAKDR